MRQKCASEINVESRKQRASETVSCDGIGGACPATLRKITQPCGISRTAFQAKCCQITESGWPQICLGVSMNKATYPQDFRCAIEAWSHEIIDQVLLEIWRRPSLCCTRRMAEWELRAWLLGILSRAGGSDPSLGFLHFSRPLLWHEAIETVRILRRKTTEVVGGSPDTEADLRHFFNHYLIRLGEHYERAPFQTNPTSFDAGNREVG